MSANRFLLIGPAESGKTSFLAAFWVCANGAAHGGLSVKCHPADATYLEELQKAWFNFSKVPRTSAGMERSVELEIVRASDKRGFPLTIPDLSGETFDQIWTHRHWPTEFQSLLDDCGGVLLFVHPQKIEDGETLEAVQDLQAQLPTAGNEVPLLASEKKSNPVPFEIAKVPTQIQLVDSLQLMSEMARLRRPFRVGLIVSAWDTVVANQPRAKPASWLRSRMPGLLSYLRNNPAIFDFAVFGVSAQGIDYEKLTPALEETPPNQRSWVATEEEAKITDATYPIQWLIRGN